MDINLKNQLDSTNNKLSFKSITEHSLRAMGTTLLADND